MAELLRRLDCFTDEHGTSNGALLAGTAVPVSALQTQQICLLEEVLDIAKARCLLLEHGEPAAVKKE